MSENNESKPLTEKQKFIIEVIVMAVVGFLVILPLVLYGYHFLI